MTTKNTTEWTWTENLNPHLVSTTCESISMVNIQSALEAATDKAISFLPQNIEPDSLYMLFEWSPEKASLDIVITDPSKTNDAPTRVCCTFESLPKSLTDNQKKEWTDNIKLGLKDYLTTCAGFMQFSLVAAFHGSDRSKTELL